MSLSYIVDPYIGKWRYLKTYIPDFDYHKTVTDYADANNIVGHQQRAFNIYWVIKENERTKGIGLDIGCGQVISPYCIGIDSYSGHNHPQYGGEYWPHVRCLGESLPFASETFDLIIGNHILNVMKNTIGAITEWLRVLKPGGKIAIILPDRKHDDTRYISSYTAEEFEELLKQIPNIKIIEHDTFKNNFSFNTVIEKV